MSTIKKVTTNYSLRIPIFDAPGWGREMERNFEIVDSVMFLLSNFGSVKGLWLNGTAYISGDRVIDPNDGRMFQALVDHTSASSGTFAQDRAAHPTYWKLTSNTVQNRGEWVTATTYNVNDFIMYDHKYGVAVTGFTSGVSYDADVLAGNIVTLIDLTDDYEDVTTAAEYVATMETAINALYAIRTDISAVAAINTDVAAVSAIAANVTTVAGIDSDVTAVAAISTDVQTLAAISADIELLASISAAISAVALNEADISTVADHIANVDTVAAHVANVDTVAASATNVDTVATNIADVNSVAANMSDINDVADELPNIMSKANVDGSNIDDEDFRGNLNLSYDDLPWLSVPIGGIIALPTELTGVIEPPKTSSLYRFAKLTAGLTGSGAYNNGVLGSESVTGSAPLVVATASVTLTGSPLNGQTISLLNSEGRFMKPGTSSGTKRNDQMQRIIGNIRLADTSMSSPNGAFSAVTYTPATRSSSGASSGVEITFDSATSVGARTGTDTYPKHIEMTYYMRVK